jgi:large subunit ribosomal protein L15
MQFILPKQTMTTLHTLPKIVANKSKRLGRGLGSGKGSKSGRGTTRHQKARTKIPLHFEGGQGRLVKKYPLLRGKSQNKRKNVKPFTLRLSKILTCDHAGTITLDILIQKSIVPSNVRSVKVVYDTQATKPLHLQLPVTAQVAKTIAEAGGSVIS